MKKAIAFTERNIKELTRDPLSYIFCLGFPLIMLIIMSVINESIPPEAGMTLFQIGKLCGGIMIFGQTFIMLFTALTVSQDRAGSFLVRMYATPMVSADFIAGYTLPLFIIALAQGLITAAASFVISLISGGEFSIPGALLAVAASMPSALMFTSIGILFGTLFNEKAAPGLCSIVISLGSFLGCIFFDAEATGGIMLTICKIFPFFYCSKCARAAIALDLSGESFLIPLAIVSAWAAVLTGLAALAFGSRMKADLS
ncbi:MAG: ABC transporter permease [Ruminiclostridium sp.]|nr:ABC transporter permease [Ruminiclostridium sp.]